MKQKGMVHFYSAPRITVFESLNELNISKLGEVADQQEDDMLAATILAAMWASTIKKAARLSQDSTDGRVLQILEHRLSRFILSCLKGKREASYNSLYNWAREQGRSERTILCWNKNCSRACKELWRSIPKSLKRSNNYSNGSIVWAIK